MLLLKLDIKPKHKICHQLQNMLKKIRVLFGRIPEEMKIFPNLLHFYPIWTNASTGDVHKKCWLWVSCKSTP